MIQKERDDNNRRIAEWLGLGPNASGFRWDFYADEAANAMLLETLPDGTHLVKLVNGWQVYSGRGRMTFTPDRKTAIADAVLDFIQWKELEGRDE